MKLDISDGFYCIALNVDDIPKLGVAFPSPPGHEPLVAFPLALPMGWENSPPIFSAATETIADLTNLRIRSNIIPHHHHLDDAAEAILSLDPAPRSTTSDVIPRDPCHIQPHHLPTPTSTLTTSLPPHNVPQPSAEYAGCSYTPSMTYSDRLLLPIRQHNASRFPSKN